MGLPIIGDLIGGVAGFFGKREDRKRARESAEAKLAMHKELGAQNIEMSDAEWEALSKRGEENSWKDEYVTLVITLPIPAIFVGALVAAITGDGRVLAGVRQAMTDMQALLTSDYGELLMVVVLAAVGIKGVKSFRG